MIDIHTPNPGDLTVLFPQQIHRGKQCLQESTETSSKEPKNASGNGLARTHDVLGYDRPRSRASASSLHSPAFLPFPFGTLTIPPTYKE